MKRKAFACGSCDEAISVQYAELHDDGNIFCIGYCKRCQESIALNIETLIGSFYEKGDNHEPPKGN